MNLASALPTTPTPYIRRPYITHSQKHVAYLATHYAFYTLSELEKELGIPAAKIKELCRRHGIRKRAPNKQPYPKRKPLIPVLALAA